MPAFNFSTALLKWFSQEGRKNLPWQQDISPYRIWVSEVMLQQTQVRTVIPYFERFMSFLPDISALAHAPIDQVLHLWTGLGYYSRARNLHRSAQILCNDHQSQFPDTQAGLEALPGIGRSTAGAILSIALNQRAPILDGNVKRVLARFHGIEGWPGDTGVAAQLWQHAEQHTPHHDVARFTQAIMDLGALVCTRTRPDCPRCPLHQQCVAHKLDKTQGYPGKKPRKTLPVRQVQLIILRNDKGNVLLLQRPPSGVWGGLWSFPEITTEEDPTVACRQFCRRDPLKVTLWQSWRHTFSHFHLDITPVLLDVGKAPRSLSLDAEYLWLNPQQKQRNVGLSAVTAKLLDQLATC